MIVVCLVHKGIPTTCYPKRIQHRTDITDAVVASRQYHLSSILHPIANATMEIIQIIEIEVGRMKKISIISIFFL